MTLRDELLGATAAAPAFTLVLPSGWAEYDADERAAEALGELARRRLREAHRPDLLAQVRR